MKKTVALLCALLIPASAGLRAAERPLPLVRNGVPAAAIVIADEPDALGLSYANWLLDRSKTTRYAAEFLQRYLARVSGAELPIVAASTADRTKPLILVGRSALTDFAESDRRKLRPEGFILRRRGDRVAIVGEIAPETDLKEYRGADRGTLFGVFEFLERVAGVRWYFPHELGVVVPKKPSLSVEALDVTEAPFFPMRWGGLRTNKALGEYGDCTPVTRPGNSTGFNVNHTCYHWYAYAKTHPEVFAVDADGESMADPSGPGGNRMNHLCYSNPKTLELELQEIRDFDEKGIRHGERSLEPSEKYVRFFPKDIENIYHCHCARCKAQWTQGVDNSGLSNLIFGHAAKLAGEVAKRYPGRRLATGAYCGFLFPPTDRRVPDNMDVMICTVKGGPAIVGKAYWEYNTALLSQWAEQTGKDPKRLFLFEYLCYPGPDAPALYPRSMRKWFQFLKGKVSGGYNNGYPERDVMRWRFSLLNGWLWNKLLWNPDENVDALLAGWCRDLFGPAEKPMAALFNRAIDCWEGIKAEGKVNPGAVSHFPDRFVYRTVYPAEAVSSMKNSLREARLAVDRESVCGRRVEFFGEAFDFFFQRAAPYHRDAGAAPGEIVVRRVRTPPAIDGTLADPAWREATPIPLVDRTSGETPPVATSVRLLHDGANLYVAAVMETPDAAKLAARGRGNDAPETLSDDRIEIDFDLRAKPILEIPTFYRIAVNPAGAVADGVKTVPFVYDSVHHSGWNEFWNAAGLRTAARTEPRVWTVTMAVPLTAFPEYARKPAGRFRMQITRVSRSEPRGEFSLSRMEVESYEYDLGRLPAMVLR